jgi:hypothetical protein
MSNADLQALSRRLRGKSLILLDCDMDFALDLIHAAHLLEDLRIARQAVDSMIAEAVLCTPL